jgi:hypothetical protein
MTLKPTSDESLHPLDVEAALLARCVEAGKEHSCARSAVEANVFAWSGFVLRCDAPENARRMELAADNWFAVHPEDELSLADVYKAGWIRDLSWLRDALSFEMGLVFNQPTEQFIKTTQKNK